MFNFLRYKSGNSKLQLSFKKRYKTKNVSYFKNFNKQDLIIFKKPTLFYFIYFKLIRKFLKNLFGKSYLLKSKMLIKLNYLRPNRARCPSHFQFFPISR